MGTINLTGLPIEVETFTPKWIADPSSQVCEIEYTSDVTGVVNFDVLDGDANLIMYLDTSGVSTIVNQKPIYTGVNFIPNSSTPPAECYALASDLMSFSGTPGYRFEFNIAKLLTLYPSINDFIFKLSGRSNTSKTITVIRARHGADEGGMTMVGSPGSYIPSNDNTTNLGAVTGSGSVVGGADGTYGIGIGVLVRTFTYNRISKDFTVV